MLKIIEILKSICPEIITAVVIAFIFYFIKETRKLIKLLSRITSMADDIKDIKGMMPHVFCRLNAQDEATKEIFNAMKNQKVNGEAEAAIEIMNCAKKDSDEFINRLVFE